MAKLAESDLRSQRYFSDGRELFRVMDTVQGDVPMVWLENCRTLTIEQVTVRELLRRRLRLVVPASSVDR